MLVLDGGGVSRLSARTKTSASLIRAFVAEGLWPPMVPTVILVGSLHGNLPRDANTHRFLKTRILEEKVTATVAQRAAELRRLAGRGSAVNAVVVALAEPGGTVVTGDRADIEALAAQADDVAVEPI